MPPITIAPAAIVTDTKSQASSQSGDTISTHSGEGGRKKTSSVSFSVDDNENQNSGAEKGTGEVKKNKVINVFIIQCLHSYNLFLDVKTLIIPLIMGRGIYRRTGQAG